MSPFASSFGSHRRLPASGVLRRRNKAKRSSAGGRLSLERFESRAMLATIQSVDTPIAAGTTLGVGAVIPIQVAYDVPVNVTGSPLARVNVTKSSGAPAFATFTGTTAGGIILNFNYTVAAGDTATDFDVILGTSPAPGFLFGGTLTDKNTPANPVDRDVANTVADPSIVALKPAITIDGVAPPIPTVASMRVNPTAWTAGAWATLHPGYFVLQGTIGAARPLNPGEVLTVSVNGATYRATAASPPGGFSVDAAGSWSIRLLPVGGNPADVPFSGALQPWSTTDSQTYNVVATLTNLAGNSSVDASTNEISIDTIFAYVGPAGSTSPSVSLVTPPKATGDFFTVGDTLRLALTYGEAIQVIGTPLLPINVTPTPKVATFSSVVGSTVFFDYTVVAGDSVAAFNVGGTPINLNGGYIEDLAGNAPVTAGAPTVPTAAPNNVVRNPVVIDTTASTVTGVTAAGGAAANGTYVAADGGNPASPPITVNVAFSEPVFVSGIPQLALNAGAGAVATYFGGSGTTTLSFSYTVTPGNNSPDLDYTSISALSLPGGATIMDAAGNNAVLTLAAPGAAGSLGGNQAIVVAAKPQVLQVTSPDPAGTYAAGQSVRIRVMFDKVVTVATGPAPFILLNTTPGSSATWTGYVQSDGTVNTTTATNVSEFTYVVRPGDTTGGAFLNYSGTSALVGGAGMNLVWAGVAIPNVLAANLTLPPTVSPSNNLPGAGIVIGGALTASAPIIALASDTANDIGQDPSDGITRTAVANVNVSNLLSAAGATWEYRYSTNGLPGAGAVWTPWLLGTGTAFTLPSGSYPVGAVNVRQTPWGGAASLSGSNPKAWIIDITSPATPLTATIPTTASGTTNNPVVTVTGVEAGALVEWNATYNSGTGTVTNPNIPPTVGGWLAIGSTGTAAFAGGTVTFSLPQGSYNPALGTGVVVRQQDLAGNYGAWIPLNGGSTVTVTIDTTIASPTMDILTANDTTPGIVGYTGAPFTTDKVTRDGTVTVGNLEVAAPPAVTGIANWQYSTNGGGSWSLGGTTAPGGTFTLTDLGGSPGGTVYAAGQVQVKETDVAGNTVTVSNPVAWTIDQTAPTAQGITAPGGSYVAGQTVTITVNFGEAIYLSATTPTLSLDTGATATLVTPVVAGATTLQFRYLVAPGQMSAALTVTAFNLNGATLVDKAGNAAVTPLVAPVVIPGTVVINAAIAATSPTLGAASATAPGPARTTALTSLQIVFNTPVSGFTLSALKLYWNPSVAGVPSRVMSLAGASIRQVNSTTYTLTLPKAATTAKGAYMLTVGGGSIRSLLNPAATMTTLSSIYFRRT